MAQSDDSISIKESCHCCGYIAADIKEYPGAFRAETGFEKERHKFCLICASTFLSQCITYPRLYAEHRQLYASIGWIANMLRDEIRAIGKVHDE